MRLISQNSWENRGLPCYIGATMTHDVDLRILLIGPHNFPGSNNGIQLRLRTVLLPPEA